MQHAVVLASTLALTALAPAAELSAAALRFEAAQAEQAIGLGGHDGKFYVASGDKAFRLNMGGQIQFRYNATFRDNPGPGPNDDTTVGFNTRRTKLEFAGHIYENWNFKVVGAFSRSTGAFDLEDAIMGYKFDNGLVVTWGQFKLPTLREESISSKYQLAADRSVANEVFNQDRSQGVQISWQGEQVRLAAAVSDGLRTVNTAYNAANEADVALTARGELRFGDASWKKFDDFTSFRGGEQGGLVGASLHWQSAGDTNPSTANSTDTFLYTVDASYEGGGWNLYGAFIGRTVDTSGGASFDDFGAVVQGGVFVTDQTELFGRWDAVFPDDNRTNGQDFHTLTFGANHYIIPDSHAAKLTFDVQWFLDDQAGSSSLVGVNEGIALLGDSNDDQVSLRLQIQLLF